MRNTLSNASYYFSNRMVLPEEIKDAVMRSFSSNFQTLIKHLYFLYGLLMSSRYQTYFIREDIKTNFTRETGIAALKLEKVGPNFFKFQSMPILAICCLKKQ